jgi:hypothetical protein
MVHYHNIAYSSAGGKNATRFTLPQSAVAHDSRVVYGRQLGSRSEPNGLVVTVMKWDGVTRRTDDDDLDRTEEEEQEEEEEEKHSLVMRPFGELRDIPADGAVPGGVSVQVETKHQESCAAAFGTFFWLPRSALPKLGMPTTFCGAGCGSLSFGGFHGTISQINPTDGNDACGKCNGCGLVYVAFGPNDRLPASLRVGDTIVATYKPGAAPPPGPPPPPPPPPPGPGAPRKYVLRSNTFGSNWTWTLFPPFLQSVSLMQVDPTDPKTLYAIAPDCLATSVDQGSSWSPCSKARGLQGRFVDLLIKNSQLMVMLRDGDVPLRTQDGGKNWSPLASAKFPKGATVGGSYSWSGNTLVVHGRDMSAPARGAYAGFVYKSVTDGDTWVEETGNLVTMAVNSGVWYQKDFYLTTSGSGILVKRDFDS